MIKKAKLPLNCDEELRTLLKPYINSYHKKLKIKRIKNTFITYEGLVIKNGFLVIGCAFNLIGSRDKTFYGQFWRLTFEKWVVAKFGKSIPAVKVDETIAVIHSKWFNYGFWINSYVPRLLELKASGKSFKLFYPEHWDQIPYVKDVLDEIKCERVVIPKDHQVFAKELLLPETRQWTASFDETRICLVRNELIEIANRIVTGKTFPNKIYLTRKNRGNRCAENEEEVIDFLSEKGFKALAFEDYTIWEQIKMMSDATHFISIHGAGLTNLIFLPKGAFVLELVNRQYAQKEYTFPFWKLAQTIDVNYSIQLCDAINQKGAVGYGKSGDQQYENNFLVNSNLIVSIKALKKHNL